MHLLFSSLTRSVSHEIFFLPLLSLYLSPWAMHFILLPFCHLHDCLQNRRSCLSRTFCSLLEFFFFFFLPLLFNSPCTTLVEEFSSPSSCLSLSCNVLACQLQVTTLGHFMCSIRSCMWHSSRHEQLVTSNDVTSFIFTSSCLCILYFASVSYTSPLMILRSNQLELQSFRLS